MMLLLVSDVGCRAVQAMEIDGVNTVSGLPPKARLTPLGEGTRNALDLLDPIRDRHGPAEPNKGMDVVLDASNGHRRAPEAL